MNCRHCHRDIVDGSSFCSFCGATQQVPCYGPAGRSPRLVRSVTDKKIAGVCGGIAEYMDFDSTIVRLVWVLLIILPIPFMPAFLGYFVAWLVMPKASGFTSADAHQPPVIIPNSTSSA